MQTKNFFVNIATREVSETSKSTGIEFEIIASSNDVERINELFLRMESESKESLKFLAKPFNEKQVDEEREEYGEDLLRVYRYVYDLGTEETRFKIDELKILSDT